MLRRIFWFPEEANMWAGRAGFCLQCICFLSASLRFSVPLFVIIWIAGCLLSVRALGGLVLWPLDAVFDR